MFQRLLELIRKVVSKILPTKNIEESLDVEIDISDKMVRSIDLWTRMYEDDPPWVDNDKVKSLNIPSSIASEMARLVTIELESEVTGPSNEEGEATENDRATYLNEQYQRAIDSIRVETEYAVAKGGLVFKPYIDGKNIAVDYVQADNFYPVKFNSSGDLIAAIFPEVIKKGDKIYTRLEYHHLLDDGVYYISNTAYVKESDNDELGKPCPLEEVEEWSNLEGEINLYGLEKPLFSYFKMPLANNKDSKSDLGVSIFAKAEKLIKEVDLQYSKVLWEYESKETAIDVSLDMLEGGVELPKGKDRLFRKLDSDDESLYKVFSPDIRDQSLFNGLNKLLQRVEFNCGLAYGTLSDMQIVEKTATEINSSKQRSFSTVVDIQKALQVSLEHLLYSMNFLTDMYSLAPSGEYEVSYHFDDSIVVDTQSEIAITMQEVAAGLIKPEYYLMKRYGVSESVARDMLPSMDEDLKEKDYDDLE